MIERPPAQTQREARIDQFYDWIYQRGLNRLTARGITPQQIYETLHRRAADEA